MSTQTDVRVGTGEVLDLPASCRFRVAALNHTFVDLGMSPLCETYVAADASAMEPFYPLHVEDLRQCLLVQLEDFVTPKRSSRIRLFLVLLGSWVEQRAATSRSVDRALRARPGDLVVEIASNDGYLLPHFVGARHARARGRAGGNVAAVAGRRASRPTSRSSARSPPPGFAPSARADLVGEQRARPRARPQRLRRRHGAAPRARRRRHDRGAASGAPRRAQPVRHHLPRALLVLLVLAATRFSRRTGCEVFDVEELASHGGSLRLSRAAPGSGPRAVPRNVPPGRARRAHGVDALEGHSGFAPRVAETKWRLLEYLIEARRGGAKIAAYGAPAKGNTLLNYCGIRTDLVDFTVDRNPYKQGMFLPGTRIPISAPEALDDARPDLILILPWNLRAEIGAQIAYTREWGARFVVPIPEVEVL